MLASVIAFAINEARGGQHVQPSFGKKKADKDYVVPKQVIRDSNENVLKFLIVEDGVVPNTHSDSSGISAGPPVRFGDVFKILDTDITTNAFFLCKIMNGKPVPVGWVKDEVLLLIGEDGAAKCMLNRHTLIQCKAILTNTVNYQNLDKTTLLTKITPMLGTGPNATKGRPVRFSNIFYVFKVKINDNSEVSQLLLGFEPEVLPDKLENIQDVLIGWVDAKYIYRWDSRYALEFDVASTRPDAPPPGRRTKPTPIFETIDDAELASTGKSIDDLNLIPVKESFGDDGVSIPFTKNQLRYPIINIDQRRLKHPVQGNLYEIGIFANMSIGSLAVTKEFRDNLKLKGVIVDQLENEGNQLFFRGHVWQFDLQERQQVRIKVLMSDLEINKTEELISQFIQIASRDVNNLDLSQQVSNAMISLVADDKKLAEKLRNGDVSFAEAIAKRHGIHLESFLFMKGLNQIGAMTFNETLQELNKIKYKLRLLQDLQNNQLREFVKEKDQDARPGVVPETVYKWRVKAGSTSTPASRFFKFRATEAKTLSYIWLDLEDELP
jgi:hypothetical protein